MCFYISSKVQQNITDNNKNLATRCIQDIFLNRIEYRLLHRNIEIVNEIYSKTKDQNSSI